MKLSYPLTVMALVITGGLFGISSAQAQYGAPTPKPSDAQQMADSFSAPANLTVHGIWQGKPTDQLSWDPVPGASAYNIYQYGTLIGTSQTNAFTVPTDKFVAGLTYTVTALDSDCQCESLPSAIAQAVGSFDPSHLPSWVTPWQPHQLTKVTATVESNAGAPRVVLTWHAYKGGNTYSVYRDGKKIADGITRPYYVDTTAPAGQSHSYSVCGVNNLWPAGAEGAASVAVVAKPVAALPVTAMEDGAAKVQITKVIPNDDSAVVYFSPVAGAKDYRVYDVHQPTHVKYFGSREGFIFWRTPTPLSIEWNGINPATGADLVVEAVDKLGPVQFTDGEMGPGAMGMDGMSHVSINGQGDPSNVPNVIAASDPVHVDCTPVALDGEQAFFDNFRNSQPFVPSASIDPDIWKWNKNEVRQVENDKWIVRNYKGDFNASRVFVMGNHFMDTLYDGGTARQTPVIHNNNASLVMLPKATADIAGGKVLHVTFEVDAHFGGRRWCDVFVGEAGDPLENPGKFFDTNDPPTVKNNLFRWEIQQGSHSAQLFVPGVNKDGRGPSRYIDLMQFAASPDGTVSKYNDSKTAHRSDYHDPGLNGTTSDLDHRHKFDLYLSKTHFRIVETQADGTPKVIRDKEFPAGVALPFEKCQVYFVHQLYHTGNDHPDLVNYHPEEAYWINYRPWADERHWDNMGFEVLSSFPE